MATDLVLIPNSLFSGHGNSTVTPVNWPTQIPQDKKQMRRPWRLSSCRRIISMFLAGTYRGPKTYVSRTGDSLWIITTYCLECGIPYTIKRQSMAGYTIEAHEPK